MWRSIKEIPRRRVPIIMKGDSGYIDPHGIRYLSGYYDAEYRPRQPWVEHSGDSVLDSGILPTHWMYATDLEAMITSVEKKDPVFDAAKEISQETDLSHEYISSILRKHFK